MRFKMTPTYTAAVLLSGLLSVSTAHAIVVTTPAGTLSGIPSPGASDPAALDTWMRRNVRTGSLAGITTDYPRSGNGSAFVSSSDGAGKADWQYLPAAGFGTLSSLSSYSYDWYRDSSSTAPDHLHPFMALIVDADGNPTTTTDIAYLIFERAYNPTTTPAPTNTWVTETITGSTYLWVAQPGVGIEEVYNRTLSQYQSGSYTASAGFSQITGNSLVLGISLGIGSGWNDTFRGAVDNPSIAGYSANFEVSASTATPQVPVPTLSLLGLSLLGAGLATAAMTLRRRSRN